MKALALASWLVVGGLGLTVVACGSSSKLSCGTGTKKSGDHCVVAAGGAAAGGAAGTGGSAGSAGTGGAAGVDSGPVAHPPTFAGAKSVDPASDSSLQVSWDPAKDDVTATEDIIYRVYVGTSKGGENFGAPQVETPPGATSAVVANLQPSKDYFVVVRAVNQAGDEDQNTSEIKGTPTADTTVPTFSGIKAAKTLDATSVQVSWDPAKDDLTQPAGISYIVSWAPQQGGAPTGTIAGVTAPGASSFVVDSLPDPDQQYYFAVRARDAAGNEDANTAEVAASTAKDTTPPVFGGCVSTANPGATTVTVSWDAARDNTTSADDIQYNVYAFTQPVDANTPFGVPVSSFVGGTTGEVNGLKPKSTFYLVCRAQDKSGNEDTNIAYREVQTLDDSTPPTFGGLLSTTMHATSADLNWNAATDDQTPSKDIIYIIYQAIIANDALNEPPIAKSNPGDTTIALTGLQPNTTYYWVVRAQDKAGNISTNTNETSATTLVSFEGDIQPILSSLCAKVGCHGAVNPPQGLNMSDGYAWYNLVGDVNNPVSSVEKPGIHRVEPGDPTNSYMYMKITAASGISGSSMPPSGNTPPDATQKNTIKQWILQGAKNN